MPSAASPSAPTSRQTVARLRARVEAVLADLAPADGRFALLDFPDHDNVGDSAIYLGELEYFRSRGLRPAYAQCKDHHDEVAMARAVGTDAPIFFHGGGNFGDVWPWYQQFRERVMARHPKRPIVQLPQTLHFSSDAALDAAARAIGRHGAFTLLVRDRRSFETATRRFDCDVRLCPDMAFCIDPIERPRPARELLLHLREDREAAAAHDVAPLLVHAGVARADWPAEPDRLRGADKLRTVLAALVNGQAREGRASLKERYLRRLAEHRVRRGTALLGSARTVVTDRLHGHILCLLMDLPHCVLDNSYGKTSGFMAAWDSAGATARPAASVEAAVGLLRDFAGLDLGPAAAPAAARDGAAARTKAALAGS